MGNSALSVLLDFMGAAMVMGDRADVLCPDLPFTDSLRSTSNLLRDKLPPPQWRTEGGGDGGSNHPPTPEIPKALQNRAKLNPIVKTVKN